MCRSCYVPECCFNICLPFLLGTLPFPESLSPEIDDIIGAHRKCPATQIRCMHDAQQPPAPCRKNNLTVPCQKDKEQSHYANSKNQQQKNCGEIVVNCKKLRTATPHPQFDRLQRLWQAVWLTNVTPPPPPLV